jgi:hypothetical protein
VPPWLPPRSGGMSRGGAGGRSGGLFFADVELWQNMPDNRIEFTRSAD